MSDLTWSRNIAYLIKHQTTELGVSDYDCDDMQGVVHKSSGSIAHANVGTWYV